MAREKITGIYFIYAPNQKKVKIGRASDIFKRFSDLRTGFMDEGELLFFISTENKEQSVKLEKEIHKKFNHIRVTQYQDKTKGSNKEWFHLTTELQDFIRERKKLSYKVTDFGDIDRVTTLLAVPSNKEVSEFSYKVGILFLKYFPVVALFFTGILYAKFNSNSIHFLHADKISEFYGLQLLLTLSSYSVFIVYPVLIPFTAFNIFNKYSKEIIIKTSWFIIVPYIIAILDYFYNLKEVLTPILFAMMQHTLVATFSRVMIVIFSFSYKNALKESTIKNSNDTYSNSSLGELVEKKDNIMESYLRLIRKNEKYLSWCLIFSLLVTTILYIYLILYENLTIYNHISKFIIITIFIYGIASLRKSRVNFNLSMSRGSLILMPIICHFFIGVIIENIFPSTEIHDGFSFFIEFLIIMLFSGVISYYFYKSEKLEYEFIGIEHARIEREKED